MRLLMSTGAALLAAAALPACAAELAVEAPATEVTIYADGAIVHRQGSVQLGEGSHVLKVRGIGASMVEQSLRVSGTGHMQIQSIEVRKMARTEMNKDAVAILTGKAADARSRAQMAAADLAALEKRKLFLEGVIDSASKMTAQNFSAQSLHQTLDTIEHDYAANGHALVTRKAEVDTLLEAQRKAEAELAQAQQRQRDLYEVRVSVEATQAGTAALDLTYRVPDASWAAVYDMRLDSTAGKLTVGQDAAITQDTGEDWTHVALTLTTARSLEGPVHTELVATHTGLRAKEPERQVYASQAAMAAPPPAPAPMPMARAIEAVPPPMATRKLATVQAGEFTSDFKIEGEVDLPNGIVEKRLPVLAQTFDATVDLIGVPDFDAHPAILASFVNSSSAAIMGGKVGLYRDGSYVGPASMATTQSGEKATMTFGADQAVTLKLAQNSNQHGEAGTFTSDSTLVKSWTTTVKNNHKHPIKIALLGRVPVSDDEELKIEATGVAADPTRTTGLGAFADDLTVPANGEASIVYGFKARWPKDKLLTGAPL
jgi:uncharacterized protein (TIGR02231 family)